jgi:hypothetical protein
LSGIAGGVAQFWVVRRHHAMQTTGTAPRRLLAISSCVFALGIGATTLVYYAFGSLYKLPNAFAFLGMALVQLIISVTFLASARTRWRWLMLLIAIPCFIEFLVTAYDVKCLLDRLYGS